MKSYVLISGATGGLGKAFAAECAARGWNLFLTDLPETALMPLALGLTRLYGVDILYHACDLTNTTSRTRLWENIEQRKVLFHSLINVAGLDFEGPFSERSIDELTTIIRLNIESVLEMTTRVLGYRDKNQTLRIINVSSLAGFFPMPLKAVYAASKRFLLDFSLALHQELRGVNATVTALCPAGMPTNPATIRGIRTQGIMGQLTTKNTGYVAAKTIKRALAGKLVYIPGLLNRILRRLGQLIPPALVSYLIGKRWAYARSRR